jgi:two-component system sensor histidine kinase KdpD
MRTLEAVLPLKNNPAQSWTSYLLDSLLACTGSGLVTSLIAIFHLYPRIPNISIVYLLIVLALATTRGRYAAILASVVAFLSFDFFIVPPLYTFVIYHIEEWIALFVFLIDALLTGQLAVALRERAEQASRRERETRVLYDLMRVTNREEAGERQFDAIVRAVKAVLAPWGVQKCALLQPDRANAFHIRATTTPVPPSMTQISPGNEEQAAATWALRHGRFVTLYETACEEIASPSVDAREHSLTRSTANPLRQRSLCLIPLTLGLKGIGVLRLGLLDVPGRFPHAEFLGARPLISHEHTSFFWTFLDQVTALVERARLQQETMRMAILERTDALRAALLSSVSHDLRTPLTAIKAAASSLLQRDVSWDEEAWRGFAAVIVREADRLNRLVGNLLDMSRIEEGALKPEKEEYALTALIHDVLNRLGSLFAGRRVEIHLPDDLLLIEVDCLQIDQVLTNLLENAVRHTPAGTPLEVSASLKEHEILISIADRGPGIPQEDLERVFDKFYRVFSGYHASGSTPAGSGLGLSVCRGLVEAHDGRIWAQARESGGLVVSVALPCLARRNA